MRRPSCTSASRFPVAAGAAVAAAVVAAVAAASLLGACTAQAAAGATDAQPRPSRDAGDAADADPCDGGDRAVGATDAGRVGADEEADAPSTGPTSGWARYTVAPGAHAASLAPGAGGNPRAGFVEGIASRDYELAFDPSAMYAITQPVEPADQLDWNKLPGISDCGGIDLASDGVMFGWRWRIDTNPMVLEVTAYANDGGVHLTPAVPMLLLDAADLSSITPLRYRLSMDGDSYRFRISGAIRGRAVDVSASLARRCATTTPKGIVLQWAAGLYFGGTSTAPSAITARIFEAP